MNPDGFRLLRPAQNCKVKVTGPPLFTPTKYSSRWRCRSDGGYAETQAIVHCERRTTLKTAIIRRMKRLNESHSEVSRRYPKLTGKIGEDKAITPSHSFRSIVSRWVDPNLVAELPKPSAQWKHRKGGKDAQ